MECEACKFWEEDQQLPEMGFCHRYAPTPKGHNPMGEDESIDAIWPRTKKQEWCGEWSAKVEVEE
jgi:hypothetical protein